MSDKFDKKTILIGASVLLVVIILVLLMRKKKTPSPPPSKMRKGNCPSCREGFTTKYSKNNQSSTNPQYREGFFDEYTTRVPVTAGVLTADPPINSPFHGYLIDTEDVYQGVE